MVHLKCIYTLYHPFLFNLEVNHNEYTQIELYAVILKTKYCKNIAKILIKSVYDFPRIDSWKFVKILKKIFSKERARLYKWWSCKCLKFGKNSNPKIRQYSWQKNTRSCPRFNSRTNFILNKFNFIIKNNYYV